MSARWGWARRALWVLLMSAGSVGVTAAVAAATPPVADFTLSPNPAVVGQTVMFADTSVDPDGGAIVRHEWDLDANGVITTPYGSATVHRGYRDPGAWPIFLRVTDDQGEISEVTKVLTVVARGDALSAPSPVAKPVATNHRVDAAPEASFSFAPAAPVVGETVLFVSSSQDPDGSVRSEEWDLDGDGSFADATGSGVKTVFTTAGSHIVTLRATDDRGVSATAFQTVTVTAGNAAPPARDAAPPAGLRRRAPLLMPFPVVRLMGDIADATTRIRALTVTAPAGAKVTVACTGAGCPRPRSVTRWARTTRRPVRFRTVERPLRVGAVLEVIVTRRGRIGKYTRFTMRRAAAPLRRDLCLRPGGVRPTRCPAR